MIQQIADLWVKKPPHLFSSGQTLCCAPPMVPEKRVINKKNCLWPEVGVPNFKT